MGDILNLITLKGIKGSRSQITAIVGFTLNLLVSLGILKWSPEELAQTNQTLIFLFGYFFADKVPNGGV